MRMAFNTVADVITTQEHVELLHKFLNSAAETRRAAQEALATGQRVGFGDAAYHKSNVRGLVKAARSRRLVVEARKVNPYVFTVVRDR